MRESDKYLGGDKMDQVRVGRATEFKQEITKHKEWKR